jgi:hypothetical protein
VDSGPLEGPAAQWRVSVGLDLLQVLSVRSTGFVTDFGRFYRSIYTVQLKLAEPST